MRIIFLIAITAMARPVAAQGDPILREHSGSKPDLTTLNQVVQGEVVYAEFEYVEQTAVRLLQGASVGKVWLPAGTVLPGVRRGRSGRATFCSWEPDTRSLGIRNPGWACLVLDTPSSLFVCHSYCSYEFWLGNTHSGLHHSFGWTTIRNRRVWLGAKVAFCNGTETAERLKQVVRL